MAASASSRTRPFRGAPLPEDDGFGVEEAGEQNFYGGVALAHHADQRQSAFRRQGNADQKHITRIPDVQLLGKQVH